MKPMIELKGVTKTYKDFRLNNVNLTLPAGCIMGLIGENGAGKSTTMKLILDLIHPDSGKIQVLGDPSNEIEKSHWNEIGVVMDESCFPETLTIKNIRAILKNIYTAWNDAAFTKYILKFSLPENKKIKDFSRGMKMKLSIAVALSHNSRLLILDEATSGLDPVVRDEILEVFYEFIQDESHSVLISSHILSDLEKICDYITFLHKGKLIFSEEKDALLEKYRVVKCSGTEFEKLDKAAVVGHRTSSFGVEALMFRDKIPGRLVSERVSIEDIMLYYIKEKGNRV